METLTGQLGQTGNQPATCGYNTTEPARAAGEGDVALAQAKTQASCVGINAFTSVHLART